MDKKMVVLFVDDEEQILTSLERGLLDEPYGKIFVTGGKEAIEILDKEKVDVIVTDMRMPEMSGLELLKIVKEKHPEIIRMVLSGYTQITSLLTAINQGEIFKYITKPWNLEEEFKPAVREALEYAAFKNQHQETTAK